MNRVAAGPLSTLLRTCKRITRRRSKLRWMDPPHAQLQRRGKVGEFRRDPLNLGGKAWHVRRREGHPRARRGRGRLASQSVRRIFVVCVSKSALVLQRVYLNSHGFGALAACGEDRLRSRHERWERGTGPLHDLHTHSSRLLEGRRGGRRRKSGRRARLPIATSESLVVPNGEGTWERGTSTLPERPAPDG